MSLAPLAAVVEVWTSVVPTATARVDAALPGVKPKKAGPPPLAWIALTVSARFWAKALSSAR